MTAADVLHLIDDGVLQATYRYDQTIDKAILVLSPGCPLTDEQLLGINHLDEQEKLTLIVEVRLRELRAAGMLPE